jgi:hypothetical protein
MTRFGKPLLWVGLIGLVIVGFLFQQIWHWVVERVEVGPDEFLVRVHKWGKDLDPDDIVAPDESYRGVMQDPTTESRVFLNPLFWTYEREKMVEVPPGKRLVLTRLYGKRIPSERLLKGDVLAHEGERGVLPEIVEPGKHRINRHAYVFKLVDAVEIKAEQVGVRTLKIGKDPRDRLLNMNNQVSDRYVVPEGFQGVQRKAEPPGTYYPHPYVETIFPIDVSSHQVDLTDIEFPSKDGFILKPHLKVEYKVIPETAPELFVRLCDTGLIHQEDKTEEQKKLNEILQKIILPHLRGYARIEGSNFDARDFIGTALEGDQKKTNHLETFQKVLNERVKPKCQEVGIDIRSVTLENMAMPVELTDQIKERDLARVKQDKNKSLIAQYTSEQTLKAATEALKKQAQEKVEAETRLKQAQTLALQKKEVEKLRLENDLANAGLRLEAAKEQAKALMAQGKAEADLQNQQNEAEVAGLRKAIQGFASAQLFAQYHVLSRLGPALSEIFASEDSELAKVFTSQLNQQPSAKVKSAGLSSTKP